MSRLTASPKRLATTTASSHDTLVAGSVSPFVLLVSSPITLANCACVISYLLR
jgi:hypothetical protein